MQLEKITAINNWLIAGSEPQVDYETAIEQLALRLIEAGLELDMLGVYRISINPLVLGNLVIWSAAKGLRSRTRDHARMQEADYQGSVIETCFKKGRMIRYHIGNDPVYDAHPGSAPAVHQGFTEFAAIPLISARAGTSVLGAATRQHTGFSAEEIFALRQIAGPLARVAEAETLNENMKVLLATYVGEDASARVLAGQIRRGDAEVIPAVILFADMVGFTALSNRELPTVTIATVNKFFDAMHIAIVQNGGEILKMMGDGILAIFPTPDDLTAQQAAGANALQALVEVDKALDGTDIAYRASLNLGDIHYGNIGSASRLDFTAIGPAVNLASRLLSAADALGARILCTQAFQQLVPQRTQPLACHLFKGFDDEQPVYDVTL